MNIKIVYTILIIAILGGLIYAKNVAAPRDEALVSSPYDSFAQCIADAGAKFYGAYWCPHCKDQKALFKESKKLPYIECSTPNGQGQTQVCIDAGISSYPTWIFPDGSELGGLQTFESLSEKTGCVAPQKE